MDITVKIIIEIPDASPSIPSIKFNEFVTATIKNNVIKNEKNKELSNPGSIKVIFAIEIKIKPAKICVINLTYGDIGFISSINPIKTKKLLPIKYAGIKL